MRKKSSSPPSPGPRPARKNPATSGLQPRYVMGEPDEEEPTKIICPACLGAILLPVEVAQAVKKALADAAEKRTRETLPPKSLKSG